MLDGSTDRGDDVMPMQEPHEQWEERAAEDAHEEWEQIWRYEEMRAEYGYSARLAAEEG